MRSLTKKELQKVTQNDSFRVNSVGRMEGWNGV
jgi:hypothetical protein